jgi:diphthine-ammonia ligase
LGRDLTFIKKIFPESLESRHMSLSNVVGVALWMRDLSQFAAVNKVFSSCMQKSGGDPPVRACLEVGLPEQWPILLEATAQKTPQEYLLDSEQPEIPKQALHVQSLSHWAPASIGPYSQAVKVDSVVQVAGQIALDPSSGQLLEGAGVEAQCLLALRHVSRILAAMNSRFELQDVVQVINNCNIF